MSTRYTKRSKRIRFQHYAIGSSTDGVICAHLDLVHDKELTKVLGKSLNYIEIMLDGKSVHSTRAGLVQLRDAANEILDYIADLPDSKD